MLTCTGCPREDRAKGWGKWARIRNESWQDREENEKTYSWKVHQTDLLCSVKNVYGQQWHGSRVVVAMNYDTVCELQRTRVCSFHCVGKPEPLSLGWLGEANMWPLRVLQRNMCVLSGQGAYGEIDDLVGPMEKDSECGGKWKENKWCPNQAILHICTTQILRVRIRQFCISAQRKYFVQISILHPRSLSHVVVGVAVFVVSTYLVQKVSAIMR